MRPFVFVTRKLPEAALARLDQVCDFKLGTDQLSLSRDALLQGVSYADGLISILSDRIDHEVMAAGPNLKVIANVAVGYNNIEVSAAQQRGIYITNTPGVLTEATADLTWALILAITRRVVEADGWVRAGQFKAWDFDLFPGTGLSGKTLGIIGYGRIGRAVARRATSFGLAVLYCGRNEIAFRDDPIRLPGRASHRSQSGQHGTNPLTDSARHSALQDGLMVRRADFNDLLEQSDIISLHVPMAAVKSVHDQKVMLDRKNLGPALLQAIDHTHDREDPKLVG